MPNWLKHPTLLLSVILGFFTWFALVLIWTYSAPGGLPDRVISAFLGPVFRACVRIGSLVLPDYQAPHSTGWYLAPLFATLGQVGALTFTWYLCIRIKRVLQPEQLPLPPADLGNNKESEEEWVDLDGEEEPVYVPPMKSHVTKFGPTIDYEKFKFRTSKVFRKHNGHWPIFSMVFHYLAIAGMLASMIVSYG